MWRNCRSVTYLSNFLVCQCGFSLQTFQKNSTGFLFNPFRKETASRIRSRCCLPYSAACFSAHPHVVIAQLFYLISIHQPPAPTCCQPARPLICMIISTPSADNRNYYEGDTAAIYLPRSPNTVTVVTNGLFAIWVAQRVSASLPDQRFIKYLVIHTDCVYGRLFFPFFFNEK